MASLEQGHFNGARLPEARKQTITERLRQFRLSTSMEPGFLKPGNQLQTSPSHERHHYFNGARLPEARKRSVGTSARRRTPDFNGARLPEARKPFGEGFGFFPADVTSMEPGFLKPGNSFSRNRPKLRSSNFNGARLPEARKPVGSRLHWRKRHHFNGARLPEARKQGHPHPVSKELRKTSMEPGFLKPGNRLSRKSASSPIASYFNGARLPEARKQGHPHPVSKRTTKNFNGARLPEARKPLESKVGKLTDSIILQWSQAS